MSPLYNLLTFTTLALVIELIGSLIISGYVLVAAVSLVRGQGIEHARLLVIEGALTGLSIKLAATLLKTIELHSWDQILLFASVLALRTFLRAVFNWEKSRLERTRRMLG